MDIFGGGSGDGGDVTVAVNATGVMTVDAEICRNFE